MRVYFLMLSIEYVKSFFCDRLILEVDVISYFFFIIEIRLWEGRFRFWGIL